MVNKDEERWAGVERKKQREELESRIGRTSTGYDWITRVNRIGKGDDVKQLLRRVIENNR